MCIRDSYGGSPNSANAFYTAVCGDRTLEKNYWFLDGSNPATITRIAVANDGKMTSHMQVNRADVETDADVFAFETKLVPNYGLPIYVKGEARVEIPAYAAQHVDAWVYNADGKWQSDVKGLWSPSFGLSAVSYTHLITMIAMAVLGFLVLLSMWNTKSDGYEHDAAETN